MRKESRGMERLEAVSDTENGLDVLIGIAPQFLAQPPHVDVQSARTDLGAVPQTCIRSASRGMISPACCTSNANKSYSLRVNVMRSESSMTAC